MPLCLVDEGLPLGSAGKSQLCALRSDRVGTGEELSGGQRKRKRKRECEGGKEGRKEAMTYDKTGEGK